MAQSMADEIREKESAAKEIVVSAKAEAGRILASARTAAERSVKEARQRSHRRFREQVKEAEAEAETRAAAVVEQGRKSSEEFYVNGKSKIEDAADWLVKEVMSAYGDS